MTKFDAAVIYITWFFEKWKDGRGRGYGRQDGWRWQVADSRCRLIHSLGGWYGTNLASLDFSVARRPPLSIVL